MRFGIMEVQFDRLLPAGQSPVDAVNHVNNFNHGEHIRTLVEEGFTQIELTGDMGQFFPNAYEPVNIQRLAALKDEFGISYSVHLPFRSTDISSGLEHVRLASVDVILDLIEAVSPLDPTVYVLHPTGALANEIFQRPLLPASKVYLQKQCQSRAISSLQMILEESGLPSRKIAIENLKFPFDLLMEIADLLDLSICLDTGHMLAGFSGPIKLEDALQTCLPRLAEVHLNDAPDSMRTGQIGYDRDHRPLGTEDMDVKSFLTLLSEHNFNGPLIFEHSITNAHKSMEHLRELGFAK